MAYDPDVALNAAMQLFWRQGYEATSMRDLLRVMGLSKSSLYQAFGGKKELFLRCVSHYCEKVGVLLRTRLDQADSGLAFLREFLLHAATEAGDTECRRGCLLVNTASEFAQQDPEIAARVAAGFAGLRAILQAAIVRGRREGVITNKEEARVLADYLMSSLAGLKTVIKGGADETRVRAIVGVILRTLQ